MTRTRLLALTLAATALLAGLIAVDALPWLRGPRPDSPVWHWPYEPGPAGPWWLPLLVAGALVLWTAWGAGPGRGRWRRVVALAGLIVGSLGLQLALVQADSGQLLAEMLNRTLALNSNGYLVAAAEVEDLGALLRHYPEAMPRFAAEHVRTHPPGLLVAQWLTIQLLARVPDLADRLAGPVWPRRCVDLWLLDRPPAVAAALWFWSFLPPLLLALAVWPAYLLGRRLSPGRGLSPGRAPAAERKAWLAAALTATLPAGLLFTPLPDQIYPLLVLLSWLALTRGAAEGKTWPAFAAGVWLSLASFLSLGNAIWGLALILLIAWPGSGSVRRPRWRPALALLTGGATIWLLFWAVSGVSPWAIARAALAQHFALVTTGRSYPVWLLFNLVDLLVYAGPLVLAGWLGALGRGQPGLRRPALVLVLFLATLSLSGAARGETGRLWLFFLPALAVVAAAWWARPPAGRGLAATVVGGQLFLALTLGWAWVQVRPIILVAQRPPQPAPTAIRPAPPAIFGQAIALTGWSPLPDSLEPGTQLDFTLRWELQRPVNRPYTVFNHLVDPGGQPVAQHDGWPVNGQWPPTCWVPGEPVTDRHTLLIPPGLPAGAYRLVTGLYDARDGRRLTLPDGRDGVTLGTVTIQAPRSTRPASPDPVVVRFPAGSRASSPLP